MTIKPVADLYLITYEDGKPYKYTHEGVEAIDAIGAGFKVEEFVSLENHRAAMLQAGNSPVTPDCWVPVSERMPERDVDVQVYCADKKEQMVGYMERNEADGWFRFASLPNGGGVYCNPTHWMPLPAAPQQEVK